MVVSFGMSGIRRVPDTIPEIDVKEHRKGIRTTVNHENRNNGGMSSLSPPSPSN